MLLNVFPKHKMILSVSFCPQSKDFQSNAIEESENQINTHIQEPEYFDTETDSQTDHQIS